MSDITILDYDANAKILKTTDNAGVHTPHHNIDNCALPTGAATQATLADVLAKIIAAPSTAAAQTNGTQVARIGDGVDTVEIQTGVVTGDKGLRVFIGSTDPVSDLPVFVDFAHHQVHEGETYRAQSLALDATTMFRFSVPAGYSPTIRAPHLAIHTTVYGGTLKIELFEGFSGTPTAGTALVIRNRNRNVAIPAPATVAIAPVTGSLTGTTLLETIIVAAGNGVTGARSSEEWVLKPNTDYLIVATEVAAFTNTFITFDWYEDLGV